MTIETENTYLNKKVNRIYEKMINGEMVYCIEHTPTGICTIFDYDESALKRVLEESKKRVKQLTPHSFKKGDGRQLEYGKSRHGYCATSLATVLYSHYKGIPLDELIGGGGQIRHYSDLDLPDNYEDCRSKSLYSTKDIVMETDSRKITLLDNGKYIRLDLKPYGVTEYLSNTPGMLELIGKPNNMSFFVNKGGRTQVKIYHPVCDDGRDPYLNTVAYACYFMGVNESNFTNQLPDVRRVLKAKGVDIDHLNSDIHNNCAWNLSVMPSGSNSSKRDYVGRIKPPYFLYAAVTESGEYKIRFGYQNFAGMGQEFYIICPDESVLRHFLRNVMDIDKAPCFLRRFQIPKLIWGLNKKAPYAALNFERAAKEAERLLSMDESKFILWNNTGFIGVRSKRG